MSDGVRETQCTRCMHRHICKYKEVYLKAVEAVSKVEVIENGITRTPITMLEFLNPIELDCRYEEKLN